MTKGKISFFSIFILLLACGQKETNVPIISSEISQAHDLLYNKRIKDSSYKVLKSFERNIAQNPTINDSIKAENDYLLGRYFLNIESLDSASYYLHRATNYIKDSLKNDHHDDYFNKAWDAYRLQGKYGDCITISNRFRSLIKNTKQKERLAVSYHFDEDIYLRVKDFDKALESNKKSISIYEEISDSVGLVSALVRQAELNYYYLNNVDKTFQILDNLSQLEPNLSPDSNRIVFEDRGVYRYFVGDYKGALQDYLKALKHVKKTPDDYFKKSLLVNTYSNIAEVYIDLNSYENAQKYLDSVNMIGIGNVEDRKQKNALKYQLRLSLLTGDSERPIRFLDTIFSYRDKAFKEKYNNDLVALTKANENEKALLAENQMSEIENLKLQTRVIVILSVATLIGILGFLWYRKRKYAFEKESLQMQQRLLRSQMSPHFISNTLYAIQTGVINDKEEASKYLTKFSRLLRLVLENSMQNYVSLEKELESLRKYMDLQLLRFSSKFSYTIELINMEEDDLLFIPPMLIQPFVENSIEHGFLEMYGEGIINISLVKNKKFIECIIEDNGRGVTQSKVSLKKSASTTLISDFISKATKSQVVIQDRNSLNNDQSGTIVKFQIPFKLTEND